MTVFNFYDKDEYKFDNKKKLYKKVMKENHKVCLIVFVAISVIAGIAGFNCLFDFMGV